MQIYEGGEQVSMFDAVSGCWRTLTGSCPPTMEKTSEPCLNHWQGSRKTGFMFLNLRNMSGGGGATQELLSEMRSLSLGESRTRSIGAYPSGGSASLFSPISMDYLPRRSCLSAILEENPDPKYDLSPKACLGILRRAVRRGKVEKMPEILVKALEYQAGVTLSEIISMAESSEKTPCASTLVGGVTDSPCSSKSESDAVYGFPLGFRPENVKCYEETATTLCNGTRPGFTTGIVTGAFHNRSRGCGHRRDPDGE